ncbi:MAG: HD domain-containing protein [Ignavibacteriales bacterium]|nr:HD domain-containing protein [Ignavibacteriales bacterium]
MNRESALVLMHEYTQNESLRKHMLCVETAMRAYAIKFNQDEEAWGIAGLLHDFDYEKFQTVPDHPLKGSEILKEHVYSDEIRIAILGHASLPEYPRESLMAKTLFACDELCGFLVACSLVKPDKKIASVEVSSVKKKLKDKAFARNVSREDILNGSAELGVNLDDHIQFVIDAMKANAEMLGL